MKFVVEGNVLIPELWSEEVEAEDEYEAEIIANTRIEQQFPDAIEVNIFNTRIDQ